MSDSKELSPEERAASREEIALATFLARWRALPPLIRAGTAEELRRYQSRQYSREKDAAEEARKAGLPRRAAVYRAFTHASNTLHELFSELCVLADEEAERVGQGPLGRAADLKVSPIVADKERIEKAILDELNLQIQGRIDREAAPFGGLEPEQLRRKQNAPPVDLIVKTMPDGREFHFGGLDGLEPAAPEAQPAVDFVLGDAEMRRADEAFATRPDVAQGQLRGPRGATAPTVRIERAPRPEWDVVYLEREALDAQDDNEYLSTAEILAHFPTVFAAAPEQNDGDSDE